MPIVRKKKDLILTPYLYTSRNYKKKKRQSPKLEEARNGKAINKGRGGGGEAMKEVGKNQESVIKEGIIIRSI